MYDENESCATNAAASSAQFAMNAENRAGNELETLAARIVHAESQNRARTLTSHLDVADLIASGKAFFAATPPPSHVTEYVPYMASLLGKSPSWVDQHLRIAQATNEERNAATATCETFRDLYAYVCQCHPSTRSRSRKLKRELAPEPRQDEVRRAREQPEEEPRAHGASALKNESVVLGEEEGTPESCDPPQVDEMWAESQPNRETADLRRKLDAAETKIAHLQGTLEETLALGLRLADEVERLGRENEQLRQKPGVAISPYVAPFARPDASDQDEAPAPKRDRDEEDQHHRSADCPVQSAPDLRDPPSVRFRSRPILMPRDLASALRAIGIERSTSPEEAKRIHRRSVFLHHPDRNPGNVELAKQQMRSLNKAWGAIQIWLEHRHEDMNGKWRISPDGKYNLDHYFDMFSKGGL